MGLTSRLLALGALACVLLGVLWLYARPEMAVLLADQLWACFN